MNPVSAFAIYFIIWWTSLFAVLSFGLKTQQDSGEVVPGTPASAPQGRHMLWVFVINTLVATMLFAAFYYVFAVRGWNFDQLPQIIPSAGVSKG
jgi:predicted secreted protein